MIRVSIPHSEMQKLNREIQSKYRKYEGKVKRIVDSAAGDIESDAKKNIVSMVSSGMMSAGRYQQGFKNNITKNGLSATIYHEKFYAPYVEFGTGTKVFINESDSFKFNASDMEFASQFRRGPGRNANARPALFPSFYKNRPKIVQKLKDLDL